MFYLYTFNAHFNTWFNSGRTAYGQRPADQAGERWVRVGSEYCTASGLVLRDEIGE